MSEMKTVTINGVTYTVTDPVALSGTDTTLTEANKAADAAAVGAALAGKAPAGYGLGVGAKTAPNNDADQITRCGYFRAYVNTPTGDWWVINQEDLYGDGTYLIQHATCFGYTHPLFAERVKINDVFLDWEWLNPPMVPGVEYRTTERWNNKPVYAMAVDIGELVDGAGTVYANANRHGGIRVCANAQGYVAPFFLNGTLVFAASAEPTDGGIAVKCYSNGILDGIYTRVCLWYTKD